jgi:hypothetical protein
MPAPHEKLAEALTALQSLQKSGRRVIQSGELSRVHRERLLEHGFLQEVMKGWLISTAPQARDGDSTPWYASFWEFCARYSNERFGDDWHLSPEQSVMLLAENTVIPRQVVVYSPKGTNHSLELLFGTSLYDLKQADMPEPADVTVRDGLRLFSPSAALWPVLERAQHGSVYAAYNAATDYATHQMRSARAAFQLLEEINVAFQSSFQFGSAKHTRAALMMFPTKF